MITVSEVHATLHKMREALEDACSQLSVNENIGIIPAELDYVIDTALKLRSKIRTVVPYDEEQDAWRR